MPGDKSINRKIQTNTDLLVLRSYVTSNVFIQRTRRRCCPKELTLNRQILPLVSRLSSSYLNDNPNNKSSVLEWGTKLVTKTQPMVQIFLKHRSWKYPTTGIFQQMAIHICHKNEYKKNIKRRSRRDNKEVKAFYHAMYFSKNKSNTEGRNTLKWDST